MVKPLSVKKMSSLRNQLWATCYQSCVAYDVSIRDFATILVSMASEMVHHASSKENAMQVLNRGIKLGENLNNWRESHV